MSIAAASAPQGLDLRPVAQGLAATRAAEFRERLGSGSAPVFVLIDPLLGDPLMSEPLPEGLSLKDLDDRRSSAWGRASHVLQLPPGVVLDSKLAPYLVEMDGRQDPWLATTIGWAVEETLASWATMPTEGHPHRIGGWLQSAAFTPTLVSQLSAWLALSTETATRARYLRVADRRVWSLAVHVLGADHVARRLAPVQSWHWLDAHAAWQHLDATMDAEVQAADPQPLARFSRAQWSVMAQGPAIHQHMACEQSGRVMATHTARAAQSPRGWPPVSDAQWRAALAQANHKNTTRQDQEGIAS
mgnify:CR=1 FL=1